jgi:pyruvate/2-oxoglutarate dehydrogenase complex dihydrolipoamide dehydrogenase (E3) component
MRTQSNVSSRLVDDLRTELEQSGIDLYHGHGQFRDERTIQIADPSGTIKTIVADNTIVATGSRARFANKSARKAFAFLYPENRDGQMRLRPSLYAIGDVNGISLLDSTAFSQASVAIESILGRQSRFDPLRIPHCTHTEPAAAAVGLLEEEATAQGLE